MDGCKPADFYEDYKKLYAKAIELNTNIWKMRKYIERLYEMEVDYSACESELEGWVIERSRVIHTLEKMIGGFKLALAAEHTEKMLEVLMQAKA